MRPYLASAVLRSRFRLLPSPPAPALAAKARRASTGQLAPQQADRQQQQQQRSPASEGGLARGRSGAPPSGSAAAAADGSMDGGAEAANGVSPDPGQYLYDLYAVVCHRGSFQASATRGLRGGWAGGWLGGGPAGDSSAQWCPCLQLPGHPPLDCMCS